LGRPWGGGLGRPGQPLATALGHVRCLRVARSVWNARQRDQVTNGAAGWRAARRRTSRRSTSSKACHRAGLWRKLVSSSIGIIDEIRFVVRSLGTISAICQRARRRHRRSARLVCGTGPRRQAAHGSHSSRVVSRIRGAGCRARPHRASEARRRGRSRSRAAHEGSDARCKGARQEVRKCGSAALGETTSPSCPNVVRPPVKVSRFFMNRHDATFKSS
jgi:hypothetical protein